MKVVSKVVTATALLTVSLSSANAATFSADNMILHILRDGLAGDSMLIDTNVTASEFANPTASWTSSSALTTAINDFLLGATSVEFYVAGRFASGLDSIALLGQPLADKATVSSYFTGALPTFATNVNTPGSFWDLNSVDGTTLGGTENWAAGIAAGDAIHFGEVNLFGNGYVVSVPQGADGALFATTSNLFATDITVAEQPYVFSLGGDGSFSYAPPAVIPVPAAVWLFGSGLIGLVGVARRRHGAAATA